MKNVEDVAKKFLVDPETVRRWIRSQELKATRKGIRYEITEKSLSEFEKKRRKKKQTWTRRNSHKSDI